MAKRERERERGDGEELVMVTSRATREDGTK
jgi:hypothetical protein